MKKTRMLSWLLVLVMLVSVFCMSAFAAETEEQGKTGSGYVLMNIPYDEFYAAEGVEGVDAVTSATVKTYNQNMAGGSYHEGYAAADPISDAAILGVTYPVYVEDLSVLAGLTEVKAEDTATITVASGKSSTVEKEVSGVDLLFASGSYAYYVMDEAPNAYKTLSVDGEDFGFSATTAVPTAAEGMEVEMAYGGHYTDIDFAVAADEITDTCVVNGITLTTSDGEKYALRHVEDIWRKTSLGWNWDSLDGNGLAGKTITGVTYYIVDNGVYSVYEYAVNETVKLNPGTVTAAFEDANTIVLTGLPEDIANATATVKTKVGRGETATVIAENVAVESGKIVTTDAAESGKTYVITVTSDNYGDVSDNADYTVTVPGYVLMNIPYDEFYAAEGVEGVDAVTSATVKTYNQNMAGGSYHEGYAAADPISDAAILGVTYPVYVEDLSVLAGLTEVRAEDTATITVASGKSSTVEKEVSGVDLLFASGSYAYYVMDEAPNAYKTLSVDGEDFSFSATTAVPTAAEGMEVEMAYGGHYTDIDFAVAADEITDTCVVNGITLTTSDGEKYALRHVEDIWRKTSLGWNWDSLDGNGLAGKTITGVTYYIVDNGVYSVYEYAVNETVKLNPGTVTAAFEDANTIVLTGLPEDIANATATVKTKVGRGETATVIAENVAVESGKIVTTDAAESGKTYVITVTSDNYGDVSVNADCNVMPFTDVLADSFYEAPVLWAVSNGITNGMTETTFGPNGTCNRAQVVTFLWRAAGSPEPSTKECAFTDVQEGTFYYNAVLWAVENGITTGISDTEFAPNAECSRVQVVTFLWRAMGKQTAENTENVFTDVNVGEFYFDAVLWAVENGITNGMTETSFVPNASCNRAQVVTFLYRAYAK